MSTGPALLAAAGRTSPGERRDLQHAALGPAPVAELGELYALGALKIRIGRECGHDQDEWPGRTEAIVPALPRASAQMRAQRRVTQQ